VQPENGMIGKVWMLAVALGSACAALADDWPQWRGPGRGGVCWSHPAYALKHVFARNDNELVCASLALE
jgi:hypothetical protein